MNRITSVLLLMMPFIPPVAEESWLIGNVPPPPGAQRLSDFTFPSETIKAHLIQEQAIGLIPILFESQTRYLDEFSKQFETKARGDVGLWEQRRSRNPPRPLRSFSSTHILAVKGKRVSESLPTDMYAGVKMYAGEKNVEYTYFLADDTTLRKGKSSEASLSSNSLNVTVDSRLLPVNKLPVLVEVADRIGNKLLASVSEIVPSNQVAMFSIPMQGQSKATMPHVVSLQITSIPEISLLSGYSYIHAYYGWTNSVARFNQLLKRKKPKITLSVFLQFDTESGRIRN